MADEKDVSGISQKCTICGKSFDNIKECYKHELITHSLKKYNAIEKGLEKRINTTLKFLNTVEKLEERDRLAQQLSKCKSGQELKTIFQMFCMNMDNLNLIFTRIQTCLEKELQSVGLVRVYPFGSIASGLALRDCDIDIYLDVSNTTPTDTPDNKSNQTEPERKIYNRVSNLMHRSRYFTDVIPVRSARVPIIKCTHNDTGFRLDINVSQPASREATKFIAELIKTDVRIHELMLFIKLWAKNNQIIYRESMTSFCLITLVIFFLQQPRKSVHAADKDNRILKSVKELQVNCAHRMVQGVNVAYDLSSQENKPKLSTEDTTWNLIKEFFDFYQDIDFENQLISPYYGKLIPKQDVTPDKCDEYYKQLNTITQYLQGEPAKPLQMDRAMCIQDAFCLNQNTAKKMSIQSRQHIVLCLQNAKNICDNSYQHKPAEIYQKLLFDTITTKKTNEKVITALKRLQLPKIDNSNNGGKLHLTLIPSKADFRSMGNHYQYKDMSADEILRLWCQHHIEAIRIIISSIYRMDIQNIVPTQQKQQKIEKNEAVDDLNKSWFIFCTVDLWTSRCFQRNLKSTFMSYQLQQSERLHNLRRQNPKYSVTLNGILKLNVLPNSMGIEIDLETGDGVCSSKLPKKSCLRKFFNSLKSTLQSFILKEFIESNGTADENMDTGATKDNSDS